MDPDDVIGKLRETVTKLKDWSKTAIIIESRDKVLTRFQRVFSPEHVGVITEEEFRSFLSFKINGHWTGLQRGSKKLFADLAQLRQALAMLLDQSLPVADRLNSIAKEKVGIKQGIATPILLISNPARYGVWNGISEKAMKRFELWPAFDWGESFGNRYIKVNRRLLDLRDKLKIDLWALDAVWWYLLKK